MTAFFITLLVVLGLNIACSVFLLAHGIHPKKTSRTMAGDLIVAIMLFVWAAILLAGLA